MLSGSDLLALSSPIAFWNISLSFFRHSSSGIAIRKNLIVKYLWSVYIRSACDHSDQINLINFWIQKKLASTYQKHCSCSWCSDIGPCYIPFSFGRRSSSRPFWGNRAGYLPYLTSRSSYHHLDFHQCFNYLPKELLPFFWFRWVHCCRWPGFTKVPEDWTRTPDPSTPTLFGSSAGPMVTLHWSCCLDYSRFGCHSAFHHLPMSFS